MAVACICVYPAVIVTSYNFTNDATTVSKSTPDNHNNKAARQDDVITSIYNFTNEMRRQSNRHHVQILQDVAALILDERNAYSSRPAFFTIKEHKSYIKMCSFFF
ncbi:hypothetical protein JOB18_046046 [Solea senegalensis]|uniref:Uncharacterized protein n=1 Tax=Solea senegalensis TaxID=28829 RepID=A0AAV6S063_SOLSE|nr:hypothetical protein JOB18_046046 [Solea senegalensis]